jgi:hypothetical protein
MTLAEQCNLIRSREDLVAFIRALNKDLRDNPDSWENPTLDQFLEALGAWIADMDGYYINQGKAVPERVDWKIAGEMLMAASMYE